MEASMQSWKVKIKKGPQVTFFLIVLILILMLICMLIFILIVVVFLLFDCYGGYSF